MLTAIYLGAAKNGLGIKRLVATALVNAEVEAKGGARQDDNRGQDDRG